MSAITGTTVTNVTLSLNTAAEVAYTAATNTGTLVTDTETFDITPTKAQSTIILKNVCGATVTFTLLDGEMWAAIGDLTPISVTTGKVYAINVDTAKFKTNAGIIKVKATPTAGTALTASSGVGICCVQS